MQQKMFLVRDDDPKRIIPTTWWEMEKRDKSYGQTGWYHGNSASQVIEQVILRLTKPGDVIIDPFFGSGTTAYVALAYGRKVAGMELQADLVQTVWKDLEALYPDCPSEGDKSGKNRPSLKDNLILLQGDSSDDAAAERILEVLYERGWHKQVKVLFFHPPYHNIIRFAYYKNDLSNQVYLNAFLAKWREVVRIWHGLVDPTGAIVLHVGDIIERSEWIPLGFLMHREIEKMIPGIRLRAIAVKNIINSQTVVEKLPQVRRFVEEQNFFVLGHEYLFFYDWWTHPDKTDDKERIVRQLVEEGLFGEEERL